MPELPDVETYLACLRARVVGARLERVRIASPFVLRSVDPPVEAFEGLAVRGVARLGKRVVLEFEASPPLFLVVHPMIAGRFQWSEDRAARGAGKITLATFHFGTGTLVLTEAGTKKRAALHAVGGTDGLRGHDPGGLELLEAPLNAGKPTATVEQFGAALRGQNRTLKRILTDPSLFSGIGNAYSDEILHAARLSPVMLTSRLTEDDVGRLHGAARKVLSYWTAVLVERFLHRFPGRGDITAFRPEFAAHGKFGKPCPVCGTAIQRIVHGENETNYCPRCQTGGKVLADRSLSRLLKEDWPSSIEEWEASRATVKAPLAKASRRTGRAR